MEVGGVAPNRTDANAMPLRPAALRKSAEPTCNVFPRCPSAYRPAFDLPLAFDQSFPSFRLELFFTLRVFAWGV
jgi:hypothetical protein